MSTYDRIELLLNSKHEILLLKIAEVKEDTAETKIHAKETNGHVATNLERIHRLEVEQNEDNKFRKRSYYMYGTIFLLVIAQLIKLII